MGTGTKLVLVCVHTGNKLHGIHICPSKMLDCASNCHGDAVMAYIASKVWFPVVETCLAPRAYTLSEGEENSIYMPPHPASAGNLSPFSVTFAVS
jgi:hypothetical protein